MTNIQSLELKMAEIWLNAVRCNARGFILGLKKKHPFVSIFNSHDDALTEIRNLVADGCDVFVGIGNVQPEATRRIAENGC